MLLGKSTLQMYNASIPLVKAAGKAFEQMKKAAQKEGIILEIVSGYRSYERQKQIWNRKYIANKDQGLTPVENINKIIEYSTLPGTSRHHWGCDVDLIDATPKKEGDVLLTEKFHKNGPYEKMRIWMDEHAEKFGFFRPYTNDPLRKGFYYEPWHFSYAPISIPMLDAYLQLDLEKILIDEGLEGSTYLTASFLNQYREEHLLGIAAVLKTFE